MDNSEYLKAIHMAKKSKDISNEILRLNAKLKTLGIEERYQNLMLSDLLIDNFKGTIDDFCFIMDRDYDVKLSHDFILKLQEEYGFGLTMSDTANDHKCIFFNIVQHENMLDLIKIKKIFDKLEEKKENDEYYLSNVCKFCIYNEKDQIFINNISLIKSGSGFKLVNIVDKVIVSDLTDWFIEWNDVFLFIESLYFGRVTLKNK